MCYHINHAKYSIQTAYCITVEMYLVFCKMYCSIVGCSTGCKKTNLTYIQKVNDKNKSVKIEFPFIVYNLEVYTLFYFNIQASRVIFLHLVLESIKRHCSSLVTYWHNGRRTSLVPIIVKVALAIIMSTGILRIAV